MRYRTWRRSLLFLGSFLPHASAFAGGFDIPDLGAEALGRGATFTAKADSALALHYNVAGLARQRGTHLFVGANLIFHSFEFQRAGTYPDQASDPRTPWGGKEYAPVRDTGAPGLLPIVAATSDFGVFERVTFGAGLLTPSSVPNRVFLPGVRSAPSAARYDAVSFGPDSGTTRLVFPTLGAAVRVAPFLDVGAAIHLAVLSLSRDSIAYTDPAPGTCQTTEDLRCESRSITRATGNGVSGSMGVLLRPSSSVQFGAQFRLPTSIVATGTTTVVQAAEVLGAQAKIAPTGTSINLKLPWVLRLGARYVHMERTFERADIEADLTIEGWGAAQGEGIAATVDKLSDRRNVSVLTRHGYQNTYSVRLGGAYNFHLLDGVASVRAGSFFDSTATPAPETRVDFDTLSKVGFTVGVGYKWGPFAVNLGYAAIPSLSRTVDQGAIRPTNAAKGAATVDSTGAPLPATNAGSYSGFVHTCSLSVEFAFERLWGQEKSTYGDPAYESLRSTTPAQQAPSQRARAKAQGKRGSIWDP